MIQMGDENIGMKTGWARDCKSDEGRFFKAVNSAIKDNMFTDWTGDGRACWVKRDGHKIHSESPDGINTINRFQQHVFDSISVRDFDNRGFAGNSGWCRFIQPFEDAKDRAFNETGSFYDAWIAGMKAMGDYYGVAIPAWIS
tara:strand:+ start:1775 stop:2200 length:426 start_codon:yes stop_codon:yes gene_type:complete